MGQLIAPTQNARSPPRTASPSRERGFTLLEMLIVLALMGLIAALVLPRMGSGVSTGELKSAARQLASGLRFARDTAVSRRVETALEIDVDKRSFRVPLSSEPHRLPPAIDLKVYTAQQDIVNEQVGAIRFFPDGGSNGGKITVASGERKYEVSIDWLTGRVAISE